MGQYGKIEYWDERYTREVEPFDWYQRWTGLKDIFVQYLATSQKVLHIGCGNSKLTEDMYGDGFLHSVNIDISKVAIKAMQEKYAGQSEMTFVCMDAKKLEFGDGEIEAVVDKGTLDCLLCGDNSIAFAQKLVSEVYRVLAPNGCFLLVSYGQPPQRYPYLDLPQYNWEITVHQVPRPTIPTSGSEDKDQSGLHYIYACKKRRNS